MLQFVLGRAGSGKTETVRRMLSEKSRGGDGQLLMLVPEQYSFETEKAMLQLCGPQGANRVQVYSFTRLAEAVFRREGGAAGRRLSDGGRRVLMSQALSACEDRLEVYRNAVQNGRLVDLMLTAVNEMKLCGVPPQRLSEAAGAVGNGGLSKKLSEIALLYGTYEALVSASFLDPRDDLTRLTEILRERDVFRGAVVAVDSFEGFTAQELTVLRELLKQAELVVVALCTDGLDQGGLFSLVDRTRGRLSRLAGEEGVKILPPVELTGSPRFRNENLKLLEAQLFSGGEGQGELLSPDHSGVEIFEAADVYEEAEFAAATIRRLVEERGWRYRDFSIICRDPQHYYGSLDVALKKRDVPCFVSEPAKVDGEPVMRLVLGAFDAVQSGFRTEDLLELMKTGVSGFTAEEISDLENYAFLWRLDRGDWKSPFVRHPRGFGQELGEEDRRELDRLNALRERLMAPLLRFGSRTRDNTGEEISQAVFDLLEDFRLEETLPAYCEALSAAGEESLAQKQLRVWDLLMELLDQFHSILGDRKVPRERYGKLFREVVAAEDVSEIPQTVDQVLFGTVEQVRQSSPKAAFLIGASQGDFPLNPKSSGVFSDAERRELLALDLPLGDPLEQKTMEERYLCYSVACAPSELLYVSWPRTAGGEEKEPSELVNGLRAVFPTLKPLRDLPDEYFANSGEAAFSRMAARFREDSGEAAALRLLFADDGERRGRVEALERAAGQRPQRVEDRALARRLFGADAPGGMFLSPTQIEVYHNCPFQYFCRYGLKARERRPAEVDVMQYGTLMHWLFERVFQEDREVRWARTEEELLEHLRGLIQEYAQENLGGNELLSGREKYRLERLALSACKLIRHVEEELRQSRFTPAAFELKLEQGGPCPPLRVDDGDGGAVTVGGTIDRADVYTDERGREYVRVVDYKTGRKVFKLSEVFYGLNMQMLVYLAALVESGERIPAGILYLPAAEPSVSADRGDDEEKIKREADRQLRMNGLLLEDPEVIRAMEENGEGRFVPAVLKKDGAPDKRSSVLTGQALEQVLRYVKGKVGQMGRELKAGRTEAAPAMINTNTCKYCPYGEVCGREYDEKDVRNDRAGIGDTVRRMEKIHGEEGQNG